MILTRKKRVRIALFGIIVLSSLLLGLKANAEQMAVAVHANLFAARACALSDPDFCPGGVWDQAAFDEMYLYPETVTDEYPSGETGAFVRMNAALCETEDCAGDTVRCTDGTRPVFFYDEGSGAGADKWIITIQGGGDTCNPKGCIRDYLTVGRDDFSSAYGRNPDRRNYGGIFSLHTSNLFRNYNRVRIDKCVGDRNLGDTTVSDFTYQPDNEGPLYFHGFRVIKAVMLILKDQAGATPDLEDATTIAFMTQSNGSNGGYLYMDRLRQYVLDEIAAQGNEPDVRYLASSFVFPGPEIEYALNNPEGAFPASYLDAYGHVDDETTSQVICGDGFDLDNPSYQDWMDAGEQVDGPTMCLHGIGQDHLRGIGGMFFSTADIAFGRQYDLLDFWGAIDGTPTIDASCLAAHQETGDVEACYDSTHVMLYHLTTPTFFSAQAGDRNLRTSRLASWTITFDPAQCDIGDENCHTENYRGDKNNDDALIPSEGGWQKEDFQERVMAIMAERFEGQSAHQEQPLGMGHGAFIDNTVDHMAFKNDSKVRRTMIPKAGAASLEHQAYIYQWLDPSNGLDVVCVDDGQLYDAELAPLKPLPDAPAELVCNAGAYDIGKPIDAAQTCNDPFDNTASTSFSCLVPSKYHLYLAIGAKRGG